MPNKITLPTKVENFTQKDCEQLIENIESVFNNHNIKFVEYYIVGSYCFNVDSPDDVDVLCITTDYTIDVITGEGYDFVNLAGTLSWDIRQYYTNKISLMVSNTLHDGHNTTIEGIKIPSYNLKTQELLNKIPYEIVPHHFHYSKKENGWVTFQLDKKTRIDH